MNRYERIAWVFWAFVFFSLSGISFWLATHEERWRVLHWIEVVAFLVIGGLSVISMVIELRATRGRLR